jgi:hypothetical protein
MVEEYASDLREIAMKLRKQLKTASVSGPF